MQADAKFNAQKHKADVLAQGKSYIESGFAVIPVRVFERSGKWDKAPLARAFQTLDSNMNAEEREGEIARWRKEKNRVDGEPLMIGATRTPSTLSKVLAKVSVNANERLAIGLPAGPNGFTVIDLDRHHEGQDGVRVFADAAGAAGIDWRSLPHCETAGGGVHVYVKGDPNRGNGAGQWTGQGVDVRGVGGYVVAPGAVRPDGKAWTVPAESPPLTLDSLPPMPDFISERLGPAMPRVERSDIVIDDADHPRFQQAAIDYLLNEAPSAVKGCRDSTVVHKIAPKLRDLGITETVALDLIERFWNNDQLAKCEPPLTIDELTRDVRNAYQYAKLAPGNATGSEFGAVETENTPDDPYVNALALCARSAESLHQFEAVISDSAQAQIDPAIDAVLDPLGDISSSLAPNMGARATKLRADLLDAVASVTLGDEREAFKAIGRAGGTLDLLKASIQTAKRKADSAASERKTRKTETIEEAIALSLAHMNEPLIDGVLDTGTLSVVYGESNSGKTFLVLDMAAAVAMGAQFNGRNTKRGMVYYAAAEGGNGVRLRLNALTHKYGDRLLKSPFVLDSNPVDLRSSDTDADAVIANVREHEARTGSKCEMIVIDTLSRALAGGEENGSTDMGAFVSKVDKIRAATGAHVLVIHHSGKDRAKGARGHSLLRAATDTEIEVADSQYRATKQRDMPMGAPVAFQLTTVAIGQDPRGRTITSCVVRYDEVIRPALSDTEKTIYAATVAAAQSASKAQGISYTTVQVDAAAVASELPLEVREAKGDRAKKLVTDTWRLIEKKPGWLQRHAGKKGEPAAFSVIGDTQAVFEAVKDDEAGT